MKKRVFLLAFVVCVGLVCGCESDIPVVEVPVFLYHSIKPGEQIDTPSNMVVSKENFEQDLVYLAENGYTAISTKDLGDYYANPTHKLPQKPVVITFDDGYADNYTHAFPLLKKHNTKATIFLIVWSVGRDTAILTGDPINPHFGWTEAKEMIESGLLEMGSHTFDLHNPEGLSYGSGRACGLGLGVMPEESAEEHTKRVVGDLKKSKSVIEQNTQEEVVSFAYPYGVYNEDLADMVKSAGFGLGFITESDEFSQSLYKIRRFGVTDDVRVRDILESAD